MNRQTPGMDKYSTFGLREKWLRDYLNNIENWFETNTLLGSKQIPAVINWLRDAELLNRTDKKPGKIGMLMNRAITEDINLVWEIIWTNLYYNAGIVEWYVDEVNFNEKKSKKEMLAMLLLSHPNLSEGTANNPLTAMLNTLSENTSSTLGKIGRVEKKGNAYQYIYKYSCDHINPISIAFALYRFAHAKNRFSFTVSELYKDNQEGGPYKLFGISKERLENNLRALQENKHKIVRVDLAAGLDNITLREDLNPIEILELLMEK